MSNHEFKHIINDEVSETIISILHKIGIHIQKLEELEGYTLERDVLINVTNIENIKENIEKLKKTFTTTSFTSLQSNAFDKQKWPVLNLIRQILKLIHYKMVPIRKANGYDCNKKKLYKRFFLIKQII